MILDLLDRLHECGVNYVINTSVYSDSSLKNYFNSVQYIEDVRSAVFTGFGVAKSLKTKVLVFVDDAYLPNTLTALTEAWFQRVPIIILSLNSNDLYSSLYLDRCVDSSFFFASTSTLDDLASLKLSDYGPTLIKVNETFAGNNFFDYSSIYELLRNIKYKGELAFYNPVVNYDDCIAILSEYKYGILSKYYGYLLGGKDQVLCVPEDILALDSNIFNFRTLPKNLKLVVKSTGSGCWEKFIHWLQCNKIRIFDLSVNMDSDKFEYALNNAPCVIFVK